MTDIQTIREQYEQAGQGQVFTFFDDLNDTERASLIRDTTEIDLEEVNGLVHSLLKGGDKDSLSFDGIQPAPYIKHPENGGDAGLWNAARETGEAALRAGKVAAFTVAGGQGTRLGFDGPKGTYPVTPVSGKTLFNVFANKIKTAGERYGKPIPWFIMTSQINHEATVKAFQEAEYYGLEKDQVMFFSQGRMPAVDYDGKIMLQSKSSIAMSPDGHGGSLRALERSGAVARMKALGITSLSYFQVDNPLVKIIDPAFIGFHVQSGSEMSSKMIPKAYPGEKVGHFCVQDGKTIVVEYSDLPEALQEERDGGGQLRFLAGSIAIHLLDIGFVERIGKGQSDSRLPFHRADKKIATLSPAGLPVAPEAPNGIKFEMFVFDALPFASNPVIIETLRENDFSPVKNATGVDSAETAKADQLREWTRWLLAAGVELERDETGLPKVVFEISPTFADCEAVFIEKWNALPEKKAITDGTLLN